MKNRTGSLSFLSRESQAAGHSVCRSQSLTSVVLPNPAGAETSVSLWPDCRPWFNRSTRRWRGTSSGRRRGINSLVARS